MAAMQAYMILDRLKGAFSHPGANVPYVTVGQHVLFQRERKGWQHACVASIDGKDVYVLRAGRRYSVHESRVKP